MLLWRHLWGLLCGWRVLLQRLLPVEPLWPFVWWGYCLQHHSGGRVVGHFHCLWHDCPFVFDGVPERCVVSVSLAGDCQFERLDE